MWPLPYNERPNMNVICVYCVSMMWMIGSWLQVVKVCVYYLYQERIKVHQFTFESDVIAFNKIPIKDAMLWVMFSNLDFFEPLMCFQI